MKFGIRKKIILSFFLVILIMCSVTVMFIKFFSAAYINSEANHILKGEASEFAEILSNATQYNDNSLGILKMRFDTKIYYLNYSMFILDENGHVVAGYNVDGINSTKEELNAIFTGLISDHIGDQKMTISGNEYTMYIKPVIDYITGQVIGYVAPFYSSRPFINNEVIVTFCIFTVCIASLFSIIIGCFLSYPLTSNIYKLKRRAGLIAEHKYDEYVPIKSNDELKELSDSIENMVTSLKEYDLGQKTFLQNAAHELKTPLMSIRGYVEGISDGVFDSEEISPEILTEVSRLEKTVGEILYLSKIETEHVMNFDEMQLSDLYKEVESRTRGLLQESGKKLTVSDYEDCTVTMDGDNFATAVTNIISNCARYAKQDITVLTEKHGNGIKITVYDDGPGILPEELPHIFERFYRGKAGKHGLGLSITKAIVQSHGGEISAYNRTDSDGNVIGAAFEIHIPAKFQGKAADKNK